MIIIDLVRNHRGGVLILFPQTLTPAVNQCRKSRQGDV